MRLYFWGSGERAASLLLVAFTVVFSAGTTLFAPGSWALDGQPEPWQIGMQTAATPIAEQLKLFHTFLLYIITGIVLFVFALLAYVLLRFNERVNPEPSRIAHNTTLEILWSVVPILILLVIAIPSFRLLYAQYAFPKADLTIKATGSQWYWSYEYPDHGDFSFDSQMIEDDNLKPGQPRLLATDNDVVVPVNKTIHVLVTASDVIHNWNVPAFGVKLDAVPGRVERTWFRAERTGTFYGQCSELCGQRHAFMPIAVRVLSEDEFARWLEKARKRFAAERDGTDIARLVR